VEQEIQISLVSALVADSLLLGAWYLEIERTQRVYCSNKATAITADVPSEAELRPDLWGKWKIVEIP
jgi:hypothetical protein